MADDSRHGGRTLWLAVALALYAAAILYYALTAAHAYDEAYHLVAAQLINAGKQPYLDFCFPQAPLNAYWNAFTMRVFGHGWRVTHGFAALFTIGAVVLMAEYVLRHFPAAGWRAAAALTAGAAFGANQMVFQYATLAQPYGICLFFLAAAFRFSIAAVDRRGPLFAALAGLAASTAAACSLLTAAACPVYLIWILRSHRAGSRWIKSAAFLFAAVLPWIPVARLFLLGPRQTWFNLVQYHARFRRLYWPDTTEHDLEVLTAWLDSGPALVLGFLAIAGLFFIARRSEWPRDRKSEFYLCGWLALAVSCEVGAAHPTFSQYYLLAVPFLAVLAAAGLYAVSSRLARSGLPVRSAVLVAAFFTIALARALYEDRDAITWSSYQEVADKVEQITPRGAPLFAIEPVYFLTNRIPPPGLELSYTHELPLPPADAALFHILSDADLKRQLASGIFPTAVNDEEDKIAEYGIPGLYKQHVSLHDVDIYWDRKR